ncbi:TIGR01777 family oxidoreductase [Pseudonocardia spinosispora]|uniref:TIGR01777 family oxidoreductase n=1 Tax=Pseudonocardia spinosispora TaxID=103441 RepID=UPI00048D3D2F|nr:TIGR01777 family oxidoreductase [Pseudonocardia spinosispora]
MRVMIAGASGLIGTSLIPHLRHGGHEVLRLVRRESRAPDERTWDPPAGRMQDGSMDGVDAIINLCGVGIADRRWSGDRKQAIKDSRVEPSEVLAAAAAAHRTPTLINASGINFYGDTQDREVDETAPVGTGFLAEVCRDWEAATSAAQPTTRVVLLRTGAVLSPSGGMLGKLRPLFSLMLGGRIGSGRQYMPWISLDDEVGAISFLLENQDVSGPVNMVGPQPATNAEFTEALGSALRRPTPFPVPPPALKAVLGAEMARELVLTGPRAVPSVLDKAGYRFQHRTVADALTAAVGR